MRMKTAALLVLTVALNGGIELVDYYAVPRKPNKETCVASPAPPRRYAQVPSVVGLWEGPSGPPAYLDQATRKLIEAGFTRIQFIYPTESAGEPYLPKVKSQTPLAGTLASKTDLITVTLVNEVYP